jgi:transcriptional regulator with XRE-family HTH domain
MYACIENSNAYVHRYFGYYADMNKKAFKKRDLPTTLTLLCEVEGEPYFKNNKIAQSELRRATGVDQGLLSRIISGTTKSMSDDNVRRLAKFFKITTSQMRGEEPIEFIDGGVDKELDEIVSILQQLSEDQLWEILRHCQILAEKNNQAQDA